MQVTTNKPAVREMAATIARALAPSIAVVILGLFLGFLLINVLLGCESWDQTLWTARNSCLTPSMIFGELAAKLG